MLNIWISLNGYYSLTNSRCWFLKFDYVCEITCAVSWLTKDYCISGIWFYWCGEEGINHIQAGNFSQSSFYSVLMQVYWECLIELIDYIRTCIPTSLSESYSCVTRGREKKKNSILRLIRCCAWQGMIATLKLWEAVFVCSEFCAKDIFCKTNNFHPLCFPMLPGCLWLYFLLLAVLVCISSHHEATTIPPSLWASFCRMWCRRRWWNFRARSIVPSFTYIFTYILIRWILT